MIELSNISKVYHNSHTNNAVGLRSVDLKLTDTGLVFIVGPSGSGKSTLLNILSGLDTPSGGTMKVEGVDVKQFHGVGLDGYRTNYAGVVYQNNNLLDHLTLSQNVALAVEITGRTADPEDIHNIFERLGIRDLENRYPHEVSGGQAQRAAIARVLIKKPKILFTDELTSNLDTEQRDEVYKLLKELSNDVLVIATTHQQEMVDRFADRVITLENGGIKEDSYPNILLEVEQNIPADGVFKFERTRLPLKRAVTLGWGHFKINKFRTLFLIILSVISLSVFALTTTLSTVSENRAILNSFASSTEGYISFRNNSFSFTPDHRNEWFRYGTNPTQFLGDSALVHEISPTLTANFNNDFTLFGIRHIATIGTTVGTSNMFGQSLSHGRWPTNTDNTNQVVISDFIATQAATALGNIPVGEILGDLHFNDGNLRFNVIGIYRTDFANYFDLTPSGHFTVPAGDFDAPNMLRLASGLEQHEMRAAVYLMQNNWVTAFANPAVISSITNDRSRIHNAPINSITTDMAAAGFFITDHPTGVRPLPGETNPPLYDLIINYGLVIERAGDSQLLPTGSARMSNQLIASLGLAVGETLDFSITREIRDLGSLFLNTHNNALPTSTAISFNVLESFSLGRAGTFDDFVDYRIILAPADYDRIVRSLIAPSTAFIVGNYSNAQLQGVLSRMPDGSYATFKDSNSITLFTQNFSDIQGVMIALSIIFGMLSFFLLFSFIMLSVRAKKKNIAILRSMGAKTADIFNIFLTEALALAAFVLSGALIMSVIGMLIGNASVQASTQNSLMLFSAPAWFFPVILGSAFVLILATYLIPSIHFARHRKNKGVMEAMRTKPEN